MTFASLFATTLTCSALVALTACDKHDDPTKAEPTSQVTDSGSAAAAAADALSTDDKAFITKAAQGSRFEVELGKVVAAKATSAEVKAFANTMVTEHGKAVDELAAVATKKGMTLPTELESSKKSTVEDYQKMAADKLDPKYADDMVEDHENDVREFKKATTELKDADLRAWATKTLPTLEHHLQMAKDMTAKVKR